MKKIIYIGNQLANRGGNPTTIDVLSRLLTKEDFYVVTASNRPNKIIRLLDMLLTVARNSNVHLTLIDTYSTDNFWYAYLTAKFCRFLKIPFVPILHGGKLPARLKKSPRASNFLFNYSMINITPSGYLYSRFKNQGFENLKFIPNSIEISEYPFLLRKVIKPKLLWVRSFAEIYNPMLALKILEGLLVNFPEASLCMVGPAKDHSFHKCKEYAESKNLPVSFTGKLDKKDWIAQSQNFDIFINTTNFDNTPVSVIEAMALGLPVISTNVGGIPFLIDSGKDGILLPPEDANLFIFEIEKMIKNPGSIEKLMVSARGKAETFDWEVVKYEWIRFLR